MKKTNETTLQKVYWAFMEELNRLQDRRLGEKTRQEIIKKAFQWLNIMKEIEGGI